jgi:hypothetical protein
LLPGLRNKVEKATLLAGGAVIETEIVEDGVIVKLPADAPDPYVSVVKVQLDGKPDIQKVLPKQADDGSITLEAEIADIQNVADTHVKLDGKYELFSLARIETWSTTCDRIDAVCVACILTGSEQHPPTGLNHGSNVE